MAAELYRRARCSGSAAAGAAADTGASPGGAPASSAGDGGTGGAGGGGAAAAAAALRAARAELEEGSTWQAKRAFPSLSTHILLAVVVVVGANDQVLKEFSRSRRDVFAGSQGDFPYKVSSVVLVASLLSVLGGTAAACASQGLLLGLRRCLDPRQLRLCCVPSVLFTYSNLLLFSALRFLGADVLAASEAVLVLGLSSCASGRAWRLRQVCALLSALLGLCWFVWLGGAARCGAYDALAPCATVTYTESGFLAAHHGGDTRRADKSGLGLLFLLGSAVLGTLARLTAEPFLKGGPAGGTAAWGCAPLLVQKTQLEVPGFFAALFWCVFLEPLWDPGIANLPMDRGPLLPYFFRGWDGWTLAVLVAALARSWLAAGAMKSADTLRYSLAQVLTMLLTFLELEVLSGSPSNPLEAPELGAVLLLPRSRSCLASYAAMGLLAVSLGAFALAVERKDGKAGWAGALAEPLLGPGRRRSSFAGGPARWGRRRSELEGQVERWTAKWGRRLRRRGWDVALVAGYVAADTGKMLLVGWANHGRHAADSFLPSSMLLVQLMVSVLIALGIAGAKMGPEGLWSAVRPGNVLRCAPVSIFFFVSKICTVAALEHVDAGTVKLSTQLILPCSALLSVCLISGRSYSWDQWISIAAICLGTLAFHAVQIEADRSSALSYEQLEQRRQQRVAGLCLCGAVVLANSVGSVVGERFLKAEKCTPLACLKARLVLAELLIVVCVLEGVEAPSKGGLWFAGWNWRVLLCALGWVPATWMSTLITARFSTVVKNLVQCLSTLVTYFLSLLDPSHDCHSPPATLLAFVVMLSVSTFTLQSTSQPAAGGGARGRSRASTSGSVPSVDELPPVEEAAAEAEEDDAEEREERAAMARKRLSAGSSLVSGVESVLDLVAYADWTRAVSDPLACGSDEAFLEKDEDFLRHHTF